MARELNQREIIEALGNLDFNTMGARGLSGLGSIQDIGTNLAGGLGGFFKNIANIANIAGQQQEPVLGPDDFGSYVIPASDPTYSSGFDYARSIAGGMPMEQVIAPGVSYSPEQPGGYTQAQLGPTITDLPDVVTETPPDDPRYLGRGIGGVNIPVDRKQIPLRNIFGGVQIPDVPPVSGLQDIGKLFDFDFDRDAIEKIVQERIAESKKIQETKPDMPTFIPEVPTGRDFSIDREILERPMISGLENRDLMDVDSLITGVPTGRGFSVDREPIPLQDFGYGSGIMPPTPPMDINKLIPPVNIPPAIQMPPMRNVGRPSQDRFSINQQLPMGLF